MTAALHKTQFDPLPAKYANRGAMSRAEVAESLGKSKRFVDGLIADGKLQSKRIRRSVFISAADVRGLFGFCSECDPIAPDAERFLRKVL